MADDKDTPQMAFEALGLQLGDFWVHAGDELLVKRIGQGTYLAQLVQATPDMFDNVGIYYLEPPKGYQRDVLYRTPMKDLHPARPQAIIVADDKNTPQ